MMMDNDFPVAIKTSIPAGPRDIYKRPDESKENYGPPPEGFQRPTPAKQAETAQFLKQFIAGSPSFQIPGGASKLTYPVLPKEDPDDVRLRLTYPLNQPMLPFKGV